MKEMDQVLKLFPTKSTVKELLYHAKYKYVHCPIIKLIQGKGIVEKQYADFIADTERLGSKLLEEGFSKARIIIFGTASYEWLIVYFGALISGNTIIPIDPNLNFEDSKIIIEKVEASIIFYDDAYKSNMEQLVKCTKCPSRVISLQELEQYVSSVKVVEVETVEVAEDDVAMITFTSGTTGANKGVELTHRNLFDDTICAAELLGSDFVKAGSNTICILPLHHMLGLTTTILFPIVYGVSICFLGTERDMIKAFQVFKPSYLVVVPMIAEGLVKYAKRKAKMSLQDDKYIEYLPELLGNNKVSIICGGAYLASETIDIFKQAGVKLLNGYGITECSPVVSCNPPNKQKCNSVGKVAPAPYCEVKVIDGEICVKGTIVAQGYFRDKESTELLFDGEWLKTGDLGYLDDEGFLFITGRKKNVIILKDGNNVSPEEIEKYFIGSPLLESILVDVAETNGVEHLVAYIYPSEKYRNDEKKQEKMVELLDHVNKNLPRYMQIHHIEIEDKPFEVTALGKVKRFKCK